MTKVVFASFILGIFLTSCSTPGSGIALPSPSPSPTPAKPKKDDDQPKDDAEPRFICKFLNGEGRIISAIDDTRDAAMSRARRRCEADYRNCVLLSCKETSD